MHTLTASNPQGESSSVVPVVVGLQSLPGLRARYYSIDGNRDVCNVNRFTRDIMTLLVDQVDADINHPEHQRCDWTSSLIPSGTPWDTVPGVVLGRKAFVEWDGFMRFDRVGNYSLGFNNVDGVRVWITDKKVIDWWSCHSWPKEKLIEYEVKEAGTKRIHIEWFQSQNSHTALQFLWAYENEAIESVPSSVLFHNPRAMLTYEKQRVVWVKGVTVKNAPVLFATYSAPTSFSVSPNLPAGLSMGANGEIQGTPTEVVYAKEFTVTAVLDGQPIQTVLTITVEDVALCSEVTLEDNKGHAVQNIVVDLYNVVPRHKISWKGGNALLWITPDLPEGLEFSELEKGFSGRGMKRQEKTTYSIHLRNDAGEIVYPFTITVQGCQYGMTFYSVLERYTQGNLYITSSEGEVFKKENMDSGMYSAIICLPKRNDYVFHYWCETRNVKCDMRIYREDKTIMLREVVHMKEWRNGTFLMEATEPPVIEVPLKSYGAMNNEKVSLSFVQSGIYKPAEITPALPEGMELDTANGFVKGTFKEKGVFLYTLTATNDKGKAEVVIEFDIGKCPEGKTLYRSERDRVRFSDSFKISDSATHEVLYERPSGSLTANRVFCFGSQQYEILMESTDSTWMLDNPMRIVDEEGVLVGSFLLDVMYNKTETFAFTQLLRRDMKMRYLRGTKQPRKNWMTADFKDRDWVDASYMNWGSFDNQVKTVYFRNTFTVEKGTYFPFFKFAVRTVGGFAVYLNGAEILRVNLPQGALSYDTPGVHDMDVSEYAYFTLPSEHLRTGSNLLAVELHRYEGVIAQQIVFDLKSTMMTGESVYVSTHGSVSSSHHDPEQSKKPEVVFDNAVVSNWSDTQLPVWIRYSYPENNLVAVTTLTITTGRGSVLHMPVHFAFFGIRNESRLVDGRYVSQETRERLLIVRDPYLLAAESKHVVLKLKNQKAFAAYELEVYEVNDGSDQANLYQLGFLTVRHHFCGAMKKYAQTDAGEVARTRCSWNRVGYKTRACLSTPEGAEWGEESEEFALKRFAGKNEAFIDTAYKLNNCTLSIFEESAKKVFVDTLVRELTTKKATVLFYLPVDCTEEDAYPAVCVSLRITPHHMVSNFVMMQLEELNKNITGEFYDRNAFLPETITIEVLEEPKLRQRPAASVVIAVIAVSLLAIILIVFMIYYTKVSLKRKGVTLKQLMKHDKKSLRKSLREKLLCVCSNNHSHFDAKYDVIQFPRFFGSVGGCVRF